MATEIKAQSGKGKACPAAPPCDLGEDDCPAGATVPCAGSWHPSKCQVDCGDRVFHVTQTALNGGKACTASHGDRRECKPAEGLCPFFELTTQPPTQQATTKAAMPAPAPSTAPAPLAIDGQVAIDGITDAVSADGSVKPVVRSEIAAALKITLGSDDITIEQITATREAARTRARRLATKYDIAVEYKATFETAAAAEKAVKRTGDADTGASLVRALKSKKGGFFETQTPTVKLQKASVITVAPDRVPAEGPKADGQQEAQEDRTEQVAAAEQNGLPVWMLAAGAGAFAVVVIVACVVLRQVLCSCS